MSLQDLFGYFLLPWRAVLHLFGEIQRYGPSDGLVFSASPRRSVVAMYIT
jgi:hypothetical protein